MAYQLCVGQEGLYTSLKPEETLIYLYDGPMVGMSELGRTGLASRPGRSFTDRTPGQVAM